MHQQRTTALLRAKRIPVLSAVLKTNTSIVRSVGLCQYDVTCWRHTTLALQQGSPNFCLYQQQCVGVGALASNSLASISPKPMWLAAESLSAKLTPLFQQEYTGHIYSVSTNYQLATAAAIFSCSSYPPALSHLFIHFPAAAEAIQWLCQLWGTVTIQTPPAIVLRVLQSTDDTRLQA